MNRALQAGFTIIELVVVIVILGILAAVAIPQFAGVQQSAYVAVEQNACIAVQSQAVMTYAALRAVPTSAQIEAARAAGTFTGVGVSNVGCTFTILANGNGLPGLACVIPPGICTP